ncbi:hypothetical protein Bb109J_c0632 [Bdellovibrio bacteriovorus]|nr:hypothetical protein EP01_17790 [Bdellovibrio bacteriovorus]BEV67212.1 hypothetical protein Bb109J_c0632 [Bdellovibrio bacteriovorus]
MSGAFFIPYISLEVLHFEALVGSLSELVEHLLENLNYRHVTRLRPCEDNAEKYPMKIRKMVRNGMFLWLFLFGLKAVASPTTLNYQGRILKADGTALEYNNVSFAFELTNVSGSCIFYREQRNAVNMQGSKGVFDIPIGEGTKLYPGTPGYSLRDVFNNSIEHDCDGGAKYTPSLDEVRILRVQFHDGVGWKAITPNNTIRSVPFANYAYSAAKLGDKSDIDFVLKSAVSTCAAGQYLTFNGTAFVCQNDAGGAGMVSDVNVSAPLVKGGTASIPVISLNVGTAAGTVAAGNDVRFLNAEKIRGLDVSATAPTMGQVLKLDGANTWVPSTLGTGDVSGLSAALSNKVDATMFPASCTAGQSLVFVTPANKFDCYNISITEAQITGTIAGAKISGDISGKASGLTATLPVAQGGTNSSTALNDNRIMISSAGKIVEAPVMTDGQLLIGKTGDAPQVANLVAGSGVTIANSPGGITISATGAGGTITSVTAGTGLSGGGSSGGVTLNLANTGVGAGTYGTATKVPQLAVDAQGRLTSVSEVTISGVAPAGTAGGDLGGTYPNPDVVKLRGKTISATAPTAAGQVLRYDGTGYVPNFLSLADIRSTVTPANTIFPSTACTAAQTLTWSSLTDSFTCQSISITESNITGTIAAAKVDFGSQSAGTFFAAPAGGGGAPAFRALASTDLPAGAYDSSYFKQGGNSFGTTAVLGTNDANSLGFETNGTTRMTVSSAGNVGIGMTPVHVLDVSGSTINMGRFTSSDTGGSRLALASSSAGGKTWNLVSTGSGSAGGAGSLVFADFSTSGTGQFIFKSDSSVGIGTVSPASTVHVLKAQNATTELRVENNMAAGNTSAQATVQLVGTGVSGQLSVYPNDHTSAQYQDRLVLASNSSATNGLLLTTNTVAPIDFAANGSTTPHMRVNSDGNVGIGVTTPTKILHLQKDQGADTALLIKNTSTADLAMAAVDLESDGNGAQLISYGTGVTGNWGGGTIPKADSVMLRTYTTNPAANFGVGTGSAHPLHLVTSDIPRVTVTATGSVGVGSVSPITRLSVADAYLGGTDNSGMGISVLGAANDFAGITVWDRDEDSGTINDGDATIYFGDDIQDSLRFAYKGSGLAMSEKMRITSSGYVGIGTTSPSYPLDVTGSLRGTTVINGGFDFVLGTNNQVDRGNTGSSRALVKDTGATLHLNYQGDFTGGVQVGSLLRPRTDNAFDLGTTTYRWKAVYAVNGTIQTSDQRLKAEVQDLSQGLDFVMALQPKSYKWKSDQNDPAAKTHWGFMAQELEAQVKRSTASAAPVGLIHHETNSDYYGVNYSELIAPVVKALQELYLKVLGVSDRMDQLEKENQNLKNENQEIKAYLCEKDPQARICK